MEEGGWSENTGRNLSSIDTKSVDRTREDGPMMDYV